MMIYLLILLNKESDLRAHGPNIILIALFDPVKRTSVT